VTVEKSEQIEKIKPLAAVSAARHTQS